MTKLLEINHRYLCKIRNEKYLYEILVLEKTPSEKYIKIKYNDNHECREWIEPKNIEIIEELKMKFQNQENPKPTMIYKGCGTGGGMDAARTATREALAAAEAAVWTAWVARNAAQAAQTAVGAVAEATLNE